MQSRFDMIKEVGFRRALAYAGVSFALYASAMLTVALVADPLESGNATMAVEQNAPAPAEATVSVADPIAPAFDDDSNPLDQM